MKIQTVAVVGGGLMGRQIALHTARYDYQVYLTDTMEAVRADALGWAEEYLSGRVAKGKMTAEQAGEIKGRFHVVDTLEEAVQNADLVIEAIIEDEAIKTKFFAELCTLVRDKTIIASNSSRMVSSIFAPSVTHPERLLNLHYFNPALVMKLVEVVQGEHVGDEAVAAVMEFARSTEKIPILVKQEIDGFVANRILSAICDEAFSLVEKGICTYQEVDLACENALNHPMGPFRLMDYSGLDLIYLQQTRAYEKAGEMPLGYEMLKEKYDNKEWGIKTGRGFYDWSK